MSDIFSVQIPHTVMGQGALNSIGELIRGFAPVNILVITDPGIVKAGVIGSVKSALEKSECKFDIFDGAREAPPISFVDELSQKVRAGKYDLLIGVGGGSTMDTTKVVSVIAPNDLTVADLIKRMEQYYNADVGAKLIPKILIPTTAGTGSEWSKAATVYDDKRGGKVQMIISNENLPNAVIIDPELTLRLPQRITADTGMDALSHAIEAYTSCTANVFSDIFAAGAIKMISENLRAAYARGDKNIDARLNLAVAAPIAMNAAICGGINLVHLMNEPLVVKAHVPHGRGITILLPHVMEFNILGNPTKFAKIAELIGENVIGLSPLDAAQKSVEAVRKLSRDLGMVERLSDIGIREADIPDMVEQVDTLNGPLISLWNPRSASREDLARIYAAAL